MRTRPTSVNAWISNNASKLRQRLNLYNTLDEDAFQDAYLTLVQEYKRPETGSTLENAFLKAYRRISNKSLGEAFTTSHPDELFFSLLASDSAEPMNIPEEEPDRAALTHAILKYIRAAFTPTQASMWDMRQLGCSLRDTANALDITEREVKRTINLITARLRIQFAHAI